MEKFNVRCPDHYPLKCNLPPTDKEHLMSSEKYKAFFILQYKNQDNWLMPTIENYFSKMTWRLFNAGKEAGTGTKFCKVCRYALASDFGIVSLTPLNHNVFQEIGLMQGLQKQLLYILNPNQLKEKDELPFDISDQMYIKHTDEKSLLAGLEKELPFVIQKVLLLTDFESAQKSKIEEKLNTLSTKAKDLLRNLVLEGHCRFRLKDINRLIERANQWKPTHLNELVEQRFIIAESEAGLSTTLLFRTLNEPYRKYLEELLFAKDKENI